MRRWVKRYNQSDNVWWGIMQVSCRRITPFLSLILSLTAILKTPFYIQTALITDLSLVLYAENSIAQDAEEYIRNGVKKAKKGDLNGALLEYNKAIEIYPLNADAYYNRAYVKVQLKDYVGAIIDFT